MVWLFALADLRQSVKLKSENKELQFHRFGILMLGHSSVKNYIHCMSVRRAPFCRYFRLDKKKKDFSLSATLDGVIVPYFVAKNKPILYLVPISPNDRCLSEVTQPE